MGTGLLSCQPWEHSPSARAQAVTKQERRTACAAGPWHFSCGFSQPFSCRAIIAFREGKEAVTLWVVQTIKPCPGEWRDRTALASLSCVTLRDSHYLQWKLWFVSQFSFLFVHSCLSSSRQLFVGALASKVPFSSCVNYRCHKHLRHGAWFLIQMQTSWGGKQVFRCIASPGDIRIGHTRASDKPN